eukprot:scaffold5759_cov68-Cylindrotheca_fusiformis.AAC.1
MGSELPLWQYALDVVILVGGILFAMKGTYESVLAMMEGDAEVRCKPAWMEGLNKTWQPWVAVLGLGFAVASNGWARFFEWIIFLLKAWGE